MKLHIGMRKVKTLIALAVTFIIWQLIRIFLPMLEVHPIFAYVYSVIEIRDTAEKTKRFGKLRIKSTLIGLVVGLVFITISVLIATKIDEEFWRALVEFLVILLATLVSLLVAEKTNCQEFCGLVAAIAIICMVSHNEDDIYFYAVMRVVQTLIGVFSALCINLLIKKREQD